MDVFKVKLEVKSEDEDDEYHAEKVHHAGNSIIKTEYESSAIKTEEPSLSSSRLRSLLTEKMNTVSAVCPIKKEEGCISSHQTLTKDSSPFSSKLRSLLTSSDDKEKAFKCTLCSLSFSLPSELRRHKDSQHAVDQEHSDGRVIGVLLEKKKEESAGLKEAFVAVLHRSVEGGCHVNCYSFEDVQMANVIKTEVVNCNESAADGGMSSQGVMVIAPIRVDVRFGPYKAKISEEHAVSLVTCATFAVGLIDSKGLQLIQGLCVEESFDNGQKYLLLKFKQQESWQNVIGLTDRMAAYDLAGKSIVANTQCPRAPVESTSKEIVALLPKSEISGSKADEPFELDTDIPIGSKPLAYKFQCGYCEKAIYQAGYSAKLRFANGERSYLVCKECKKSYGYRNATAAFTAHLRSHIMTCEVCLEVFCCPQHLTKHLMLSHLEGAESGDRLTCKVCNKTLASLSYLRRHLKSHVKQEKTYSCTVCPKNFPTLSRLNAHLKIHCERPFLCDVCHKCFPTSEKLEYHSNFHKGEKPFACNLCSKSFHSPLHLERHKKAQHGKFICEVCGKTVGSKGYLKLHRMRAHFDKELFSCHICHKKFSCKYHLKDHQNIHTGANPYQCFVCKKRFSFKSNLIAHSARYCGKKRFSCSTCKKTFSTRALLKVHSVVHSGDEPFQCAVCKKSYRHKSFLMSHYRRNKTHKPAC